jgi:hypothetical protein
MQINLIYDSAASAAPQGFRDAIQTAAGILDTTFNDAITVNIEVGYGVLTVNGSIQDTLTNGEAETLISAGDYYSYSNVRAHLAGSVDAAVAGGVAALPTTFTIMGQSRVWVWAPEEKALGLIAADDPALDSAVGFATDISAANLVGVALHELAHALGRTPVSGSAPDIFDFYRFAGLGTRLFANAEPTAAASYFSIDNGQTKLADYGRTSDPGDFLNNGYTTNDSFNEFYNNSTLNSLTPLDLLQMEALGFHISPVHFGPTDLAFIQTATGDWGLMAANPSSGETWRAVGPSSTAYTALGTGDFNGDGQFDLAFRQTATGDWGFLTPNLTGGETWHAVGPTSTRYAVAGVADFDRDGRADIAFRNIATGDLGFMSANPSGGETWHAVGPTSTDYAVMGAADFNGDGVVDIAFRQIATGDWGYMSVNIGGGETWHAVGPTSTAYAVIGVGDFAGDGMADVAFRSATTGDWGYMSVNPSGGEIWHAVGPTSLAYAAVKVADFDGDGRADIGFRNPTTGDWGYMSANPSGGEIWHAVGPTSTDYFTVA